MDSMKEQTQPDLTSFLEWIKDRSDFDVFVREMEQVKQFMENNRAGRAVLAMLQTRLLHLKAATNFGSKKNPEMCGIVRPDDLFSVNYTNGWGDGQIELLGVLLSPAFGLKDIILDNESALQEMWGKAEKKKDFESQNSAEGG